MNPSPLSDGFEGRSDGFALVVLENNAQSYMRVKVSTALEQVVSKTVGLTPMTNHGPIILLVSHFGAVSRGGYCLLVPNPILMFLFGTLIRWLF